MVDLLQSNVLLLSVSLLGLGLAQNLVLIAMLPWAWLELKEQSQVKEVETTWQLATSAVMPSVTVVVPAYNEEEAIVDVVHSMLSLRYSPMEIVIVNDGSNDETLQRLKQAFKLQPVARTFRYAVPCATIRGVYGAPDHPNLVVVDKMPGGCKADASNAGINLSRNQLICVIDADSLLEADSLTRVVRPFLDTPDMVAVGGTIRILNGCEISGGRVSKYALPKTFLPLMQVMEYQRAFLGARLALSHWKMLTLISGAFSVFRRDITVACGGFGTDTVGEDYDLVMKIHHYMQDNKRPYTMRYLADTVCWTEAPADWRGLGVQRRRWQVGGLQVFAKHRSMFMRPRFGRVGTVGMGLALLCDVAGPVGELLGIGLLISHWLLTGPPPVAILWLLGLIILTGVLCTYITLALDANYSRWRLDLRSQLLLIGAAVVENMGYRQVNSWWRMQAGWQFLRKKSAWGSIARMKRVL